MVTHFEANRVLPRNAPVCILPDMKRATKPMPTDPNQLAAEVVRQSVTPEVSQYMSRIGREGGKKGGKARAAKLGRKKLSSSARKAAQARWKNKQ